LSKFFYEYPFIRTLALTGFITDKKRDWFKNYLPILEELKASDAQDKEILNDIHFVYVKYELSDNPNDVVVEYKSNGVSKSFTQSENNAYDYQQRAVQNCMIADSINAKNYLEGKITDQEYSAEKRTTDYKLKQAITKRSNLLLNSKSTQRMARKLLEYLLEAKPTSKIIIFSKRTEQSLAICGPGNVYNGKVTKKQAAQNFVDFKSGALRHLGVCDKVNRGANIDELDLAILETFYGSDTQATQRLGRMMRLRPDQTATVYVLIPYYRREDKPKKAAVDRRVTYSIQETQQISWARKMLRSTTINSYEVWDYRTINN
jgi:superfamily II DNA or RNA helicase